MKKTVLFLKRRHGLVVGANDWPFPIPLVKKAKSGPLIQGRAEKRS